MSNKTGSSTMCQIFILAACLALPACQAVPKDALAPSSSEAVKSKPGVSNQQLEGIETARSVKVVLEPGRPQPEFTTEDGFPAFACTYSSQDPALIASLINILQTNVKVDRSKHGEAFPNEYISMILANGETVKIVFGGLDVPLSQDDVEGAVVRGDTRIAIREDYIYLSAKRSIVKALYEWAVRVEERTSITERKHCRLVHDYLDVLNYKGK